MGTFNPSDTFRVLLVDPNENPYSLSGIFAMGSFNPSDTARVVLVDPDGNPYKATGGSGGGATIQVNGVDTSDQTLLNFVDTASVTWANPSGGIVEATAITGGTGTVTQVNTTAPITGGPITTTGTIGITQASASVNGFLSSTDWNTFNNKQPAGAYLTAVTANAPLSGSGTSGSHLVISQAGAATDGYLSSTDWNTFNNKVGGPAGLDTQVQFNDGGSFGGDAGFVYDKATDTVSVGALKMPAVSPTFNMYPANGGGNFEMDSGSGYLILNNTDGTLEVNKLQIDSTSKFFGDVTIDGGDTLTNGFVSIQPATYTTPPAGGIQRTLRVDTSSAVTVGGATSDIYSGIGANQVFGTGGAAELGIGLGLESNVIVAGSGSNDNQWAGLFSGVRVDIGTGYTQSIGPTGQVWGMDLGVHGPIAVQPHALNGIIQVLNNYYNGSPVDLPSAAAWFVTQPGTVGAGIDATHAAATTYPVDVGLGVVGNSSSGGVGFTTGIQIGGAASVWGVTDSKIGTGLDISDFTTRGIYVNNPIGTPTADIETTGKVIVGGNLTNSVLTASELVGTDASKNLASVAVGTGLSLSAGTLSATGGGGTVVFQNPGLRLTLTTGVPVTTSDVTAAGTLYWTPMFSGNVWYWDGSAWQVETITEQSLSLTLTSGKNYDVFYLHGTGLVLSSAWTNDTTRADALGTQNGVTVLASDHTKLWIGTIRASGTNIAEDSKTKRFVYNGYNKVKRQLIKLESTDQWAYTSTTWRQANGSAANQVEAVVGDLSSNVFLSISILAQMTTNGTNAGINIGEDTTTTPDTTNGTASLIHCSTADSGGDFKNAANNFNKNIPLGYHKYVWLESGDTGVTFFSFNSGQRIAGLVGYSDN